MLISYQNGQTGIVLRVKVRNSSVATGAGLTGLTNTSSGMIISTIADNEATPTVYTVAASHIQTIATLGIFAAPSASNCRFGEVDATNHKGVVELQIDNTRYAVSGAKSLLISLSGAANMAECDFVIPLLATNPYDGVRGGQTALPNAAAAASGGLPTIGVTIPNATAGAAGGLQIAGSNAATTYASLTVTAATTFTGNVSMAAGLTVTQSTANGHGITVTGNGTGSGIRSVGGATGSAFSFVGGSTSGVGIAITTTSGDGVSILPTAGNAIVATANGTSKHGIVTTGGTAGTSDGFKAVAGTGGVDVRGNLTGNITGNLSGSAGSVSGSVGSISGVTFPTNFSSFSIDTLGRVDIGYVKGVDANADGTAQGGSTTTVTLASGSSAVDGAYKDFRVRFVGGTGSGVDRYAFVASYVGSTKVATLDRTMGTALDNTTQYALDPPDPANVLEWRGVQPAALDSEGNIPAGAVRGTVVTGSSASAVIVSGLPTGKSYVGTSSAAPQKLYDPAAGGEGRFIASQSYSSPNYTFTLGGGTGENGPFSATPTTGKTIYILP